MGNTKEEDRGWNIYRRGDGQWVLQYRTAPGKWPEARVPREHHTERQAERWALAYLAEYRKKVGARPEPPEPDEQGPTIRGLLDKWLELVDKNPKVSPGTRKQHHTSMNVHVLPYPEVADEPIADLGPAVLRAWVRKVRDDGKSRRSGRRTKMAGRRARRSAAASSRRTRAATS